MPFNDAHLTRTHALHGSRWRLCLLTNTVRVTHFVAVLTNPSFEEMCMGIQTNPAELFSGHQGLVLSSSHEELLRPRLEILCTVATDPNHRPRRCSKHHFTFASISHALPPSFPPRTRSEKATTHVPRVRAWFFVGERRNSPNRMTRLSTCRREVRRTSWTRTTKARDDEPCIRTMRRGESREIRRLAHEIGRGGHPTRSASRGA